MDEQERQRVLHERLLRARTEELGSREAAEFWDRFIRKIGQVMGRGDPIEVVGVVWSMKMTDGQIKTFDWHSDTEAILVGYIPAGMQHERGEKHAEHPFAYTQQEVGVDESAIPPREEWLTLPDVFQGLPVFYRRILDPYCEIDPLVSL